MQFNFATLILYSICVWKEHTCEPQVWWEGRCEMKASKRQTCMILHLVSMSVYLTESSNLDKINVGVSLIRLPVDKISSEWHTVFYHSCILVAGK